MQIFRGFVGLTANRWVDAASIEGVTLSTNYVTIWCKSGKAYTSEEQETESDARNLMFMLMRAARGDFRQFDVIVEHRDASKPSHG